MQGLRSDSVGILHVSHLLAAEAPGQIIVPWHPAIDPWPLTMSYQCALYEIEFSFDCDGFTPDSFSGSFTALTFLFRDDPDFLNLDAISVDVAAVPGPAGTGGHRPGRAFAGTAAQNPRLIGPFLRR
jgi:hypothetical protein